MTQSSSPSETPKKESCLPILQMLVDESCLDLARHFLQDEKCRTDGDDQRLAEAIQRAMEDWFDARHCPHTEPAHD